MTCGFSHGYNCWKWLEFVVPLSKPSGFQKLRIFKQFRRVSCGEKVATLKNGAFWADASRKREIMRSDEFESRQIVQKRGEFAAGSWIQIAGWFIQ